MKVVSNENYWRLISQFEVESVVEYAHRECRYHKVGSWFFIAFIVAVFVFMAVFLFVLKFWNVLRVIVFILAFLLLITLPVYLIVEENRKLKMIMDGKVRCMVVTVLSKRIGSRGNKGGGLYLVEIRRPDASKFTKEKRREYDVSKKTYSATQVKGKGLLIRFDKGSDEKSSLRYRFLPLFLFGD